MNLKLHLTHDTQLRIANVSANPTTVTVTIGGVAQTPINLAAGESTRFSTARARSCSGGSVSSTKLGGRQGFSLAKSLIPTPREEQNVRQSFRTACTSA